VQTGLIGQLAGGFSLPEAGFRYVSGFNGPYGAITGTPVFYEAYPDSLFPSFIELATPNILAYSPYDTSINGLAFVQVTNNEEELDIALNLLGPDTAWPTLERGDVQARFNLSQVDNIIEDIVVTVTKSTGEPAPNQSVQIEAIWVTGSGGHSHTNAPPKSKMGVLSVFLPVPLAPKEGRGIVTAQTDEAGKIYLSYATPKFGGQINLVATLQTAAGQSDAKQVNVRVPGLVPLPNSPIYEKIGGTVAHHGPPLFTSEDDNHQVNESVGAILVSFAAIYSENFPNFPKVRYNDISLPNGGLFDIDGNWAPSHKLHRIGQNVDVRTSPPREDGILLENIEEIRDMILDIDPNATVDEHGSIFISKKTGNRIDSRHFHIDFEIF